MKQKNKPKFMVRCDKCFIESDSTISTRYYKNICPRCLELENAMEESHQIERKQKELYPNALHKEEQERLLYLKNKITEIMRKIYKDQVKETKIKNMIMSLPIPPPEEEELINLITKFPDIPDN